MLFQGGFVFLDNHWTGLGLQDRHWTNPDQAWPGVDMSGQLWIRTFVQFDTFWV